MKWSEEHIALVKARYSTETTEEVARLVGRTPGTVVAFARRLGLAKSPEFMAKIRTFKPGVGRASSFQPGNRDRALAVGSLKQAPGGTWMVKVQDAGTRYGERWRALHETVWTAAHGPVPPGHIVVFKRGMQVAHCEVTLDMVELVSRAEHMQRNSRHRLPTDLVRTIIARTILVKRIQQRTEQLK